MKIKKEDKIIIYIKKDCPYCEATRTLLHLKGIEYEEIDINSSSNKKFKNKVLFEEEHLPKIYINSNLIGGYQQLVELITKDK